MSVVALMWEAKAAPEQGHALLQWARAQALEPAPVRREHFTAEGGRVLVITWWEGDYPTPGHADVPELPDPPGDLTARPVHRWRFARA
ncbi:MULTISPECIES: hypothetical protein [Streptomyces]|nr:MULTISPECIES: hypothetical protein [Streptomyces]NNG89651.1 hypothetical protein [Streptomyces cacaoi]QHF97490.1 hypothetical protein DEH18_30710 [Streptomyces sp. NHF165]